MPCPFPGMDPYLEMQPFWSDFAPAFLTAMRNDLLARLVPRYDVRIDEYVMLTEDGEELHRIRPDGTIVKVAGWAPAPQSSVAVAEAVGTAMEYPDYEDQTQRHLKIIHRPTERLVTIIELLSPANKTPGEDGLDAYLRKRKEYLSCRCHLVELDLLRGGQRLPMAGELPPGDYYAFIGRVGRKPRCYVLGWPLRSRLPTIDIPLLEPDPDVPLDLQTVFRAAYEPGLYDRRLRYDQPLEPPLRPSDEAWVREALASVRG